MTDGGQEFEGQFARTVERWGAMHHVCDAESP